MKKEYTQTARFKRLKKAYLKEDDKFQKKWDKFIEKPKNKT